MKPESQVYKCKVCTVEALQLTERNRYNISEWPGWMKAAWDEPLNSENSVSALQGEKMAFIDDWITRDPYGNLGVVRECNFPKFYEPAEEIR